MEIKSSSLFELIIHMNVLGPFEASCPCQCRRVYLWIYHVTLPDQYRFFGRLRRDHFPSTVFSHAYLRDVNCMYSLSTAKTPQTVAQSPMEPRPFRANYQWRCLDLLSVFILLVFLATSDADRFLHVQLGRADVYDACRCQRNHLSFGGTTGVCEPHGSSEEREGCQSGVKATHNCRKKRLEKHHGE